MKCPYCKHKLERPFPQCPACKATLKCGDLKLNPLESKLLSAFKNKLFLIIAILISASCLFSFLAGGLPVISILFATFLWLAFLNAKNGFASRKNLRSLSGTIYAEYLVINISAVFIIIFGFIISFLIAAANPTGEELKAIIGESDSLRFLKFDFFADLILKIPAAFFLILFILLAISALIPNLLWLGKIHNFAKSVYKSLGDDNYPIESTREARNSLFILSSISLTGHIISYKGIFELLSAICLSAAGILTAILINKHFIKNTQNKE